jgi:hypothetical protein
MKNKTSTNIIFWVLGLAFLAYFFLKNKILFPSGGSMQSQDTSTSDSIITAPTWFSSPLRNVISNMAGIVAPKVSVSWLNPLQGSNFHPVQNDNKAFSSLVPAPITRNLSGVNAQLAKIPVNYTVVNSLVKRYSTRQPLNTAIPQAKRHY